MGYGESKDAICEGGEGIQKTSICKRSRGPHPQSPCADSASLSDKADGSRLCPGEPELGLIAPAFPALPSGEGLGYIYIRKLVPASRQTWNLFPFVKLGAFL